MVLRFSGLSLLIISVYHKPRLVWIGVFYCRCFSYIRIMPAEKTNGRSRMILRVFCSFVQAGLRAAGWERESLTAGLGFYSCNPLYFCQEFFLCEIGHTGRKTEPLHTGRGDITSCSPFYRLFLGQAGRFSLLSQAVCGPGFSRKRLAGENARHSGNRKCRLLFRRHVYMYHKLKNKDTGRLVFSVNIADLQRTIFTLDLAS